AYTQESTRYVDESEFRVIIPPDKDKDEKLFNLVFPGGNKFNVSFQDWVDLNEQMYRELRKTGWVAQDARQVLPIGIKAQIVATANFREWRHIFELRCSPAAHWEIRMVMVNLLDDVKKIIPVVFDDFEISEDKKSAILKK
ncbi:MAG TPA: FAD-dependent thymidylate synthase, partial [Candidatus Parcubacteria bacterium]|nr:FAD-dependent thymidylate synthase [Candidatus Parcubacteria bacterium]